MKKLFKALTYGFTHYAKLDSPSSSRARLTSPSVCLSPSVSFSASAGPFYPDWLKRWDKKHNYKP